MSEPAPIAEPAAPVAPPAMPTPQDAQAILVAAQEAASRATAAADRLEAGRAGAEGATREQFPDMPDEWVAKISSAVVDLLRAEFDVGNPTTAPAPDSSSGAPTTAAPTSADGLMASAAPDGASDSTPPRKSLAQRILGS